MKKVLFRKSRKKFSSRVKKLNSSIYSFQNRELWIDFVDKKEILISMLIGFIIFISMILIQFQIPNQILYQQFSKSYLSIQRTTLRRQLTFAISPISSYNNFIRVYISFERRNTSVGYIYNEVKMDYMVNQVFEDQHKKNLIKHEKLFCILEYDQNISQKFILFNDYLIDYKYVDFDVVVQNPDNSTIDKFIIDIYYGSNDITTFKIYFISIFNIFFILYIIFLIFNTSSSFCLIISPVLSALIILSNNPFIFFLSFNPHYIYYILLAFFEPICDAFIYFSIIVFLELYLIRNNFKSDENFGQTVLITFLISVFYFLFSFIDEITRLKFLVLSNFPIVNEKYRNQIEKIVSIFKIFLSFSEFFIILIKIAKIDKLNANILVFVFLASFVFVKQGLIDGILKYNCLHDIDTKERKTIQLLNIEFIIKNIFGLFAIYAHWPYKKREKIVELDINNQTNTIS